MIIFNCWRQLSLRHFLPHVLLSMVAAGFLVPTLLATYRVSLSAVNLSSEGFNHPINSFTPRDQVKRESNAPRSALSYLRPQSIIKRLYTMSFLSIVTHFQSNTFIKDKKLRHVSITSDNGKVGAPCSTILLTNSLSEHAAQKILATSQIVGNSIVRWLIKVGQLRAGPIGY